MSRLALRGTSFASLAFAGLFTLALAPTVACGGDDEESAYASSDAYCAARADAECKVAGPCGVAVETCKTKRKAACTTTVSTQTSKGLAYRSGFAEGCITALQTAYGATQPTLVAIADAEETCTSVLSGTKKENEACETTPDCTGGFVCDKGFCAREVEKKVGQPCGNPGEVCEDAGDCRQKPGGGPFVCEAKKKAGEGCSATEPCTDDLRCSGTCVARFASGQSCIADANGCAKDAAYCDPTRSLCTPLVFYPASNACKDYGG